MIDEKQIQYHAKMYAQEMERIYESTQKKKQETFSLITSAAIKIQRMFRRISLKRKTKCAIKIQRWWKKKVQRKRFVQIKLLQLKKKVSGMIILEFFKKRFLVKNAKKQTTKIYISNKIYVLNKISLNFTSFIVNYSALIIERKYIKKYIAFLRNNFFQNWKKYQSNTIEQMKKQINLKWVKLQQNNQNKKGKNIFLNQNDKQIDADLYIQKKLNAIYEQVYSDFLTKQQSLNKTVNQLTFSIINKQKRYEYQILFLR